MSFSMPTQTNKSKQSAQEQMHKRDINYWQGEVGQILDDFGCQRKGTQGVWLRVRLRQTKKGRTEDSRTQETKEEGSRDEPMANLRFALVFTHLHPAGEDPV